MNPPADDGDLKPEKLEQEKEGGASFHCDLYDEDLVHKIAQEFLPGLASACVDNTTGGLFRSPASVAVEIRREMVDYLVQRSENFVAESVVLEDVPNAEVPEDPHDIIANFVDDFASSKRNFFSRVSGWLLSDKREDKIDDFVQEMEINGFWLLNRREAVGQTLLKNVDFKNIYHCSMSFKSEEDLEDHKLNCGFRTMTCINEGCSSRFCAAQSDHHDSVCPFKILKCEQNCSAIIMRREMDRHCITVCPMKLVKCPFHSVGCQSSIPQCTVGQHKSEDLRSHLLYVLQVVHKDASVEDLKERVEELIELSSGKLAGARDARNLTSAIKGLEAKLGPLKVKTTAKGSDEVEDLTDKKDVSSGLPPRPVKFEESPAVKIESVNSPPKSSDGNDANQEKEKSVESPANISVPLESNPNNENSVASISAQEDSKESLPGKEGGLGTQNNAEVVQVGRSLEERAVEPVKDEHFTSTEAEAQTGSVAKSEEHADTAAEVAKSEEHADTVAEVAKSEEHADTAAEVAKSEEHADRAAGNEESTKSPMREESKESSTN
ncbi:hypothetical protein Salat_0982400 [Sesamum alatum]|uniref:TRAF-type domain-containing protein n=1 Tax=Sesamum alatum TaxID=300844 RepID=A0AAE1YLL9_9LAMI|nr:hypothetical protein Salat_0982400 [Sesamum alatum]